MECPAGLPKKHSQLSSFSQHIHADMFTFPEPFDPLLFYLPQLFYFLHFPWLPLSFQESSQHLLGQSSRILFCVMGELNPAVQEHPALLFINSSLAKFVLSPLNSAP